MPVRESNTEEGPSPSGVGPRTPPPTFVQVDTFYIAASGTPYPIEMQLSGIGPATTTLTFSQWNKGAAPTVPKGAQLISAFGVVGNTWYAPMVGTTSTVIGQRGGAT